MTVTMNTSKQITETLSEDVSRGGGGMTSHNESGNALLSVGSSAPVPVTETLGNGCLMTYKDLSKYLRRKESALRNDVMRKRIPFLKIGDGRRGQVRFRKKDIDAWLEAKFSPAVEE